MNAARIYAILLRQFYLLQESKARLFSLFIWVAIDMVLWGFITKYLGQIVEPGFHAVPVFLGAILMWDFLSRVMQGVTMAFFEDVWSRNFLNMFASPISIAEYLAGLVLSSIVTSAIGLAVMLLMAGLVFGFSGFAYGVMFAPFLFILFLCGIALGILGSAIVLRLGPAAEWFIWPIPALISPFACVFYPMSTLPTWMQAISHLLPPSYVFENMRAIVAGHAVSTSGLIGAGALAVGYILLACWGFLRVYKLAVRSGLIARYSAESLS
ncbi:MAG TPA: ABC transporter permease [Rickettsiales bacterium]|nr:ABC transporter permease [Rickettsiales bacterium]